MKDLLKHNAVLLFTLLVLAFGQLQANEKNSVNWVPFEDALARANKENKHIVIDFYTDWCHWCKVMDEQTYKNSDVVKFGNEKFLFAKIHAESNSIINYKGQDFTCVQFTQALGIRGYPATVFMNADGEFITKISGFIKPEQFLPILEYLDGKYYDKMSYDEFMKKRTPNPGKEEKSE